MAMSARRPRGSRTLSVGSEPITLSFTAARNTDLTLTYRVLIVPGASPEACMDLIQASTSERRTTFIGLLPNGTERAASDMASTVPGAQTCRVDHSPKNAAKVTFPAFVPVDASRAASFMRQAEERLGQLPLLTSVAVKYGIAYDAAHDIGEALLAAYGFRTTNGPGQHEALGRYLRAVLDKPPADKIGEGFRPSAPGTQPGSL
jgi:hypothetical protein